MFKIWLIQGIDVWLPNIIEHQSNTKNLVNFDCLEFKHNGTITSHKGSLTKMVLYKCWIYVWTPKLYIYHFLRPLRLYTERLRISMRIDKKSNTIERNRTKQINQNNRNKEFILVNFDWCSIMFVNRTSLVWLASIDFECFNWLLCSIVSDWYRLDM